MIRGYHEYSHIWNNPIVDEKLACERELGNSLSDLRCFTSQ